MRFNLWKNNTKTAGIYKTYEKFGRDTWLVLNVDSLKAGEYLIVITPEQGNIKLRASIDNVDKAIFYENASALDIDFYARVVFNTGNGEDLKNVSDFNNEFMAKPDTWACTDGLGRSLPLWEDAGKKRRKVCRAVLPYMAFKIFCPQLCRHIPDT